MTFDEALGGAEALLTSEVAKREIAIKAVVSDQQIAYAPVYEPYFMDTQGEYMSPEHIERLGHRFLAQKLTDKIDHMHDCLAGRGTVVESFIARKGDPDFTEGTWVVGVKVHDKNDWVAIKSGKLRGFSFQARVYRVKRAVEVDEQNRILRVLSDEEARPYLTKAA